MDGDKILEKLMRWLADPKGREMFKTIVYLILPLFVLLALRNIARRRPVEKTSSTIDPKIRPSSYESLKTSLGVAIFFLANYANMWCMEGFSVCAVFQPP